MSASKYIPEIVNKIIELIETDSYTIEEICKNVCINKQTYYDWKEKYPDFLESIKKAQLKFNENVVSEAKKSLMKKIKGYEVEEVTTMTEKINGKTIVTGPVKTVKKHVQPDTTAIIFSLTNLDSENFKNRNYTELTGKNGNSLFPSEMTDEKIQEKIEELKKVEQKK